jgi:hypothetical protein
MRQLFRVAGTLLTLATAGAALGSCIGGPTYGTDKTAGEQLFDDIGDAASIAPKKNGTDIAYQPRGALIKPADDKTLVAPQQDLANSKDNPQWVESPEQARERLKLEADANKDNGSYRSPLMVSVSALSPEQQTAAYREARKVQQGTYTDRRRFMSDPPLEYRQVSDPAVLTDLGESEAAKAKRRQKEAAIAGTGQHWWQIFDN